jgi:membrane protease YdiL (CAAX protease family)
VAEAVVIGMVVLIAGSVPKNLLFAANLKFLPAIPWAAVVTAGYLWLFWRYLDGHGPPASSRDVRRAGLRANRLSGRVWVAALVAGIAGIVTLVLALRVVNRLVVLPRQEFFDVTHVSVVTIVSLIVVGAAAAGIVEEASFRGFMQGPIERRYGPTAAIVVSGTFFGLAHYQDLTPLLLPYYLAVAAIYGSVTWLTSSILPAVVLHTAGNVWSSSYLWAYGHAEWQASATPDPLIWDVGADAGFLRYLIAALVAGGLTMLAYRNLARVARGSAGRPPPSLSEETRVRRPAS